MNGLHLLVKAGKTNSAIDFTCIFFSFGLNKKLLNVVNLVQEETRYAQSTQVGVGFRGKRTV